MTRDTHSPLASSSQISKKTIRSYLQWQGPACGRVIAVSLVAGTVLKKEIEETISLRVYREQTSGCQQGAENSSNPTEEREREERRKSVM